MASYNKAVAEALKDVADAVSMQKALAVQLDYAQKALTDSNKAYDLAVMRYKCGLSPYLVVLTAESTLITQQRAAADLNAQTLAANVALVRALGGGFTTNDIAQTESKTSNERDPPMADDQAGAPTAASDKTKPPAAVSADMAKKAAARKRLFGMLGLGLACAVVLYVLYYILVASHFVSTEDAYVGADVAQVTPLVSGRSRRCWWRTPRR